jgi:hypothetical protein
MYLLRHFYPSQYNIRNFMNTPTLPATSPFLILIFPIKQADFLEIVRQDGGSSRDPGLFVRAFVF